MKNKAMDPAVDAFLAKASRWQAEMTELRAIMLGTKLTEGLKWGQAVLYVWKIKM